MRFWILEPSREPSQRRSRHPARASPGRTNTRIGSLVAARRFNWNRRAEPTRGSSAPDRSFPAAEHVLGHPRGRGVARLGVLVPATESIWGRSPTQRRPVGAAISSIESIRAWAAADVPRLTRTESRGPDRVAASVGRASWTAKPCQVNQKRARSSFSCEPKQCENSMILALPVRAEEIRGFDERRMWRGALAAGVVSMEGRTHLWVRPDPITTTVPTRRGEVMQGGEES